MASESVLMPGHLHEEHTGELRIRLWAPSLAGLFEEAARALGEAMGGGSRREPPDDNDNDEPEAQANASPSVESVSLEAHDREALLVDWLNEIIFRAETGRKIFTEARIKRIDDRSLAADITPRPAPLGRTFVKAATFHGLHIDKVPGGFSATVLFDI